MKKSSRRKAALSEAHPRDHYTVFVSHATHDKFLAKTLCEKVEALSPRFVTFRDDRDINGGDRIPEAVTVAIRSCDELVVLLTPESATRKWIVVEIAMAFVLGKRIVPLLYHVDASKIPQIIRDFRGYRLDDLDGYIENLLTRDPEDRP